MSDINPLVADSFERIYPLSASTPDWADVLRRSAPLRLRRERGRGAWRLRSRVLALAAFVGVLLAASVGALATTNEWWFADSPTLPTPQSAAAVIVTFTREGTPWELRAYDTASGMCFGIAPTTASDHGAIACGGASSGHALGGFLVSADTPGDPWLAGVTTDAVATVDIDLSDGETLSAETVASPASLGGQHRFYLVKLPAIGVHVVKIVARDAGGSPLDILPGGS